MPERFWFLLAWGGIVANLVWAFWVTRTRPKEWTAWGLSRDTYRRTLAVMAGTCVVLALATMFLM
jgi:hypothetical protein